MTDPTSAPSPETETQPAPEKKRRRVWGPLLLILLGVGAGGYGALMFPDLLMPKAPALPAVQTSVQAPVQDGEWRPRLEALEARIAVLEKRAPVAAAASDDEAETARADETASLRAALAEMQETLKKVQAEARQASDQASQSKTRSDSGVSTVIAFVQLRAAGEAGRGFASELRALRQALGSEEALQDDLSILDPLAARGALTLPALREHFALALPQAETLLRKSEAATWQDRLTAVLKSFVSIRDKGDTSSPEAALAAIGEDLAAGKLGPALEKESHLPESVQAALQAWRDQAMARFNLDSALDHLALSLIGKTKG